MNQMFKAKAFFQRDWIIETSYKMAFLLSILASCPIATKKTNANVCGNDQTELFMMQSHAETTF